MSSMYVPGKLWDIKHVFIDVGTGYYVKTAEDAKDFFKRKIDFLTKQMEKNHPALQEKHAIKQGDMEMVSQKYQQLIALGVMQAIAKEWGCVAEIKQGRASDCGQWPTGVWEEGLVFTVNKCASWTKKKCQVKSSPSNSKPEL